MISAKQLLKDEKLLTESTEVFSNLHKEITELQAKLEKEMLETKDVTDKLKSFEVFNKK